AYQVAAFVPAFERTQAATRSENEFIRQNVERIFARFDQHRLAGSFEKGFDGYADHSRLVASARQNISSFLDERCFSSSFRSPKYVGLAVPLLNSSRA